ncbi:PPE family protein [Candidatus Mycobacterium wuenschmannii]|uniref:PPE family protein n=1 Tax=Candidatus Mycobacterium wuenschmannii TaxID=3027808 RepID=A0ABY8W135_9MYCO|nr:PPE family protein [Candidatus Mycobacterium wuenschmannii]WIM88930.1 PPE family protein [Candidatus Mycobacterium wuenschmannii]
MLDFAALPPEINSGRMYSGPGPGSLLAAATAWQSLAEELSSVAAGYGSILATLTSGPWTGASSMSMAAAAAPYVTWLNATGDQAQQAAAQAGAAVSAYETAYTATIPPPLVAANRSLLATLVATNILGQNTPAIMSTEALYGEMWAQDAAAMYGYAGASSTASQISPFTSPPQTTNQTGLATQAAAAAQSAGTSAGTDAETIMSSGPQLISGMPQTLQSLAAPQTVGDIGATGTGTSTSSSSMSSMMNALSMPMKFASMPMSMLSKLFTAGSTATAAKAATTAANELGAVQSAGIGSRAGALTLAGFSGGAPAISAGMGHATSVGALSVPTAWTGATPTMTSAAGLPFSGAATAPAAAVGAHAGMPPMMPITSMGGRAASPAAPRFELRSTVVPFSPAGG